MLIDLPQGPVRTSLTTAEFAARDTGILLMPDGVESSSLDLRDPSRLGFEYHQQIDAVPSALRGEGSLLRVLHLDGVGCVLVRAWDVIRPGLQQVVVEIGEILASQVRTWFGLPRSPRLQIRVGDVAEAVAGLRPDQWNVVMRDVFNSENVLAFYRSREFFDSYLEALAPGGLLLVSITSMPRVLAGAEITTLADALDGNISRVFVAADPVAARDRCRGNLVLVTRQDPFMKGKLGEAEHAARRLPLSVRTWSLDDAALSRPEGVRVR